MSLKKDHSTTKNPSFFHRKMNFLFPKNIPKHWLGGSVFKTHLLNSFTVIFPEGEKYFIRSLNTFKNQIKDPKLVAEVKEFIQQETQHYLEHEKFHQNLRDQGYKIEHQLRVIRFMTRNFFEPILGKKMNLSTTSGLEHFTALLAEIGFEEKFLEKAEPSMKALFEWHAMEELEHKAVAYEALQAIDDSYLLKISGLLMAFLVFFSFVSFVTIDLIRQDGLLFSKNVLNEALGVLVTKEKLFFKGTAIFFRYLDPQFHPMIYGKDIEDFYTDDELDLAFAS